VIDDPDVTGEHQETRGIAAGDGVGEAHDAPDPHACRQTENAGQKPTFGVGRYLIVEAEAAQFQGFFVWLTHREWCKGRS